MGTPEHPSSIKSPESAKSIEKALSLAQVKKRLGVDEFKRRKEENRLLQTGNRFPSVQFTQGSDEGITTVIKIFNDNGIAPEITERWLKLPMKDGPVHALVSGEQAKQIFELAEFTASTLKNADKTD